MDTWEVFTRWIGSEGSPEVRWFWRRRGADASTLVSPEGFHTRAECQADAAKHGCNGEVELLLNMSEPGSLPKPSIASH
jgi:hypothetical protein